MPTVEPGRAIAAAVSIDCCGADALHGGVDADPAGELEDRLVRLLAAGVDDVGGAELAGDALAVGVAAEGDDPLGAEPLAASTADRPTAPSPTTATVSPRLTPALTAA